MALILRDTSATFTEYFSNVFGYPVLTGLAALYDFGTSASGNINLIDGGVQPSPIGPPSSGPYYVTLTGNSGYLESGLQSTGIMSAVCVVNHNPANQAFYIANYPATASASLFCNGSNLFANYYPDGLTNGQVASGAGYTTTAPTFICATSDGTTVKLWSGRNNTLREDSASYNRSITSTQALRIGNDYTFNWAGPTNMYMAAIHQNYSLTSAEVASVYQALREIYASRGITTL